MKKMKRLFAKSSARLVDDSSSSADPERQSFSVDPPRQSCHGDPPTQSNAQRRSRQCRQEIPRMDTTENGKYVSVADNNFHVSNPNLNKLKHGGYFDFRATWKTADTIYQKLSVNQEAIAIIDNTGLSAIFKFHMPNSDRSVVEACVRRWWDTTHTFHLPTCEIGLTPLDFTMLTGISVGGQKIPLPPYTDGDLLGDPIGLLDNFFPQFDGVISSGCIRGSQLGEYLKNSSIMNTLDAVTIARVFCFYILGYIFFPNASASCAIGFLNYLFDMHSVGQYDWGSAILARIYSCLDAACRRKLQSMNCFWQIIEFFFYEYMGTVTPILADPMPDTWPRIHRWIKSNHVDRAKNIVRFNLDVTTQQLEMRSIDSIIWQPYIGSPALGFEMNVISSYLSGRRYLLVDPQLGGNWYLGDRCYKQLTGRSGIPANPPKEIKKVPRYVYEHYAQSGWPDCINFVRDVSVTQYSEFWGSVSRGPSMAPLTRGVNTDLIGYASLVGGDVQLPCTPHELQGSVYDVHVGSSSHSAQFDWSYKKRLPTGEIVTLPLERNQPDIYALPANAHSREVWRAKYIEAMSYCRSLSNATFKDSNEYATEIAMLRGYQNQPRPDDNQASGSQPYYPTQDLDDY